MTFIYEANIHVLVSLTFSGTGFAWVWFGFTPSSATQPIVGAGDTDISTTGGGGVGAEHRFLWTMRQHFVAECLADRPPQTKIGAYEDGCRSQTKLSIRIGELPGVERTHANARKITVVRNRLNDDAELRQRLDSEWLRTPLSIRCRNLGDAAYKNYFPSAPARRCGLEQ